jgi:RimK family alpha-L-glutamate ligase
MPAIMQDEQTKRPKVIGYVYYGYRTPDEKFFMKIAKKNNVKIILFNLFKTIDLKKIRKRVKSCDLFYVNSGEEKALKFVKYLEGLGCRVIESLQSYYHDENKWALYLKCKKNNIPTPKTEILPKDITLALKKLEKLNRWPIVLKRIYGCQGDFVDKASNLEEAEQLIKKFNSKSKSTHPIIAQNFISSPSYRVLVINGKIVQTALKKKGFWKKTGVYTKDFKKFKVTPTLKKIINKISKVSGIRVCGVDLLKKNGRWYVLELNSSPCFAFFDNEREKIIEKVFNFLVREIDKNNS